MNALHTTLLILSAAVAYAEPLALNEAGVRHLRDCSHLIAVGSLTTTRKLAYFSESSGSFVGSTESEAASNLRPEVFAVALHSSDLHIERSLFDRTNRPAVVDLSVVWADSVSVSPNAGSGSFCPPVSLAAQKKEQRLWFLARRNGIWECIADYPEDKTEFVVEVLVRLAAERPSPVELLDPFESDAQEVDAGEPATRSESDSEGGDKPQPESEGRSR